jgi:hypothetical protein
MWARRPCRARPSAPDRRSSPEAGPAWRARLLPGPPLMIGDVGPPTEPGTAVRPSRTGDLRQTPRVIGDVGPPTVPGTAVRPGPTIFAVAGLPGMIRAAPARATAHDPRPEPADRAGHGPRSRTDDHRRRPGGPPWCARLLPGSPLMIGVLGSPTMPGTALRPGPTIFAGSPAAALVRTAPARATAHDPRPGPADRAGHGPPPRTDDHRRKPGGRPGAHGSRPGHRS